MNKLFLSILATLIASTMFGQATKTTTILINGEPMNVQLSEDGAYAINHSAPEYMAEYTKYTNESPRQAVGNPLMSEMKQRKIDANATISFEDQQIVMSDQGTVIIKELLKDHQGSKDGYVLLRAQFDKNSTQGEVLAQKRLAGIKKYLELKEVIPSHILLSMEPTNSPNNDVKVFIK